MSVNLKKRKHNFQLHVVIMTYNLSHFIQSLSRLEMIQLRPATNNRLYTLCTVCPIRLFLCQKDARQADVFRRTK